MRKLYSCLLLLLNAAPAIAATSLWDVSKGGNHFYLGASLNVLQQKHYPLPKEFEDAFKRADKLYVERDIDAISAPEFGTRVMQEMMYSDGRNLKTELTPENYANLDKFAGSLDVPTFGLAMFKPAFTLVTLSAAASARAGFVYGVDTHFYYQAKEAKKPVGTLETLDQQIVLLQTLNTENPNQLIKSTLTELGNLAATISKAEPLWRSGKLNGLEPLFNGKMRSVTPNMYQALVVKRHQAWLPTLAKLAATPSVELVLLDVIHFTGPDSLINQLKKNGYTLTPYVIQRSTGVTP